MDIHTSIGTQVFRKLTHSGFWSLRGGGAHGETRRGGFLTRRLNVLNFD